MTSHPPPDDGFPRRSPESQGMRPSRIADFLEDAQASGVDLNSFMVFRGGAVVSEGWWAPYRADLRHKMHSATKSFVSAAVGMAIAEGYFALDDKVVSFFPEHLLPATIDDKLAAMTVEDLLTQTSGHASGASGGTWRSIATSWVAEFFKIPVVHAPGTHFQYTSATSFLLSAIVQATTGQSTHRFLTPRLFQPLGITGLEWDVGPDGINPGGNGISCRTADLLKLAVLHLRGGVWQGQRLLPAAWVAAATSPQRGNRYGYQWWMGDGPGDDSLRCYYAYGLFGQFAFVFPDWDAVLVTTASVPVGEANLRALVWRHAATLFAPDSSAAPAKSSTDSRLAALLADPTVPLPPTVTAATAASAASAAPAQDPSDRLCVAQPNADHVQAFCLDVRGDDNAAVFCLWDHRGFHRVDVGLGRWRDGETTLSGGNLHHGYEADRLRVAARGAWSSPARFDMCLQFVETAFQDRVTIAFSPDTQTAVLARAVNVNSFATQRPPVAAYVMGPGSGRSSGLGIAARIAAVAVADAVRALPTPPRTAPFSTSSATLAELVDCAGARAVLEKTLPGLSRHPQLDRMRPYNLLTLSSHVAKLTPDVLAQLDADLAKVPLE